MIELLVVIAIISLLAALLLPALRGAREKAYTIMCASNLRTIRQCAELYLNESGGWYPAFQFTDADGVESVGWPTQLAYYAGMLSRPSLSEMYPKMWIPKHWGIFRCPADRTTTGNPADPNGPNYAINGTAYFNDYYAPYVQGFSARSVASIRQPSGMLAYCDGINNATGWGWRAIVPWWPHVSGDIYDTMGRHLGRMNQVYADGHVEPKDLPWCRARVSPVDVAFWDGD